MSKVDIYVSNATPYSFHLGTDDKSGKVQTLKSLPRPMHLPFFLFYGQKGTLDEVMVDGAAFAKIYGTETLRENSPYFNHVSPFIKGVLEDGGTILAKRIVPKGAEKLASVRVSLEYVETTVDEYQRDREGNFVKDSRGGYTTTGKQIPGVLYRFVTDEIPTTEVSAGTNTYKNFEFGIGSESVGDLTDGQGATSKRVPLFDFVTNSPGAHGNLSGISIWSPTSKDGSPINHIAFSDTGSYPFRMQLVTKETPTSNPVVATTVAGAREIDFSLKPEAVSKSGLHYHLGETFIELYNDLTPANPLLPPTFGPFTRLYVYQNNIDSVLELFTTKEISAEQRGDFSGVTSTDVSAKKYLFNLFGGRHSDGDPYQTYRQGELGTNGVILGSNSVMWAKGGTDGDMNDADFAKAVEAWLEEVADPNGKYMDNVSYNDSTFWDTGFPLETKLKMGKYIATRKDRWVCVSTHVAGEEQPISIAEENTRVAAIRSAVRLFADSSIYGTGAYRAVIVAGSGRIDKTVSSYKKRVPKSYELCRIVSKYWGASIGRANSTYDYTEGTNNFFKYLVDVTNSWAPYQVRNETWASGGMWSERSDRKVDFFPAFRTVYDNDSSTLTTLRPMLVHVELNKIGYEGHRAFSGKDWPEDRFLQEATDWYYDQIKDYKFGGKVEVEWSIEVTKLDKEKGYMWHTEGIVYADGQRTVQVFNTTNMRRSDKPENSPAIVA